MAKPTRAIEARRIKMTDEFKANIRHRYEHTPESLASMAADIGCSGQAVHNLAQREGWVRYVAPPRELPPAAKLLARAEKLAGALHPPLEGEGREPTGPARLGRPDDRLRERGGVDIQERSPPPDRSRHSASKTRVNALMATAVDLPPPGGGEERKAAAPPQIADNAEALLAAVQEELAEFKAARARLEGEPLGFAERERAARTLATLTRALRQLQAIRCGVVLSESHTNDDDYDDIPADLDEFRRDLARRIALFMESRPDTSAAGDDAAGPAAAAGS